MSTAVAGKGLEGVVAANSGICWIDGEAGVLSYRGIDIHELAEHSTFEETTYLLWNGLLPNELALREFTAQLTLARSLDQRVIDMLRSFPRTATPMEVLRTAVSALSFYDADEKDNSHDANVRKSYNLTAQIAMLVAIYDRIRKGKEIVPPDRSLSPRGQLSVDAERRETFGDRHQDHGYGLVLHADHELNASTFAARVIAATLSDIHSAITGAIGAMKGPLHGGANEGVMRLLLTIDKEGADPVEYVRNMLAAKQKISGFGHRVYKTEDPRATHLRKMSEQLGKDSGQHQVVRHVASHRALYQRRQEAERQRGFLFGFDLRDAGHRTRPLYARLRHQPHCRLDRARDRAVGRQPADPPPRRIHWTGLSHALDSDGRAAVSCAIPQLRRLARKGEAIAPIPNFAWKGDTMKKGYWIVAFRSISDESAVKAYGALALPAVESFGGRFLREGGKATSASRSQTRAPSACKIRRLRSTPQR